MPVSLTARSRALLGSAASSFAVLLAATVAFAWMFAAMLDLGPGYIARTALIFMGGALLFVPQLVAGHPFERFGPANQTTLGRGMLAALLAGFPGEPVSAAAAAVIVGTGLAALVLDGVDGRLARSTRMNSAFGARFDMEIDAFLVLLFAVLAWQLGKAGAWVLLSGLLRYLFLAAGWLLPWLAAPLPPSRRRQTVCVVQIAVMLVVLAPFVPPSWSSVLAAGTLVLLALSFAGDVRWLAARHLSGKTAAKHSS